MPPGWFITIALPSTNGTTGFGVSIWTVQNFTASIAKLRKRNPFWKLVGSQAVQDICQRIEKAYQLFFKHHKKGVRPPNFKKVRKYKSFTLKQAGYKFLGGNRIKIGSKVYQYWNSRDIEGNVKTLTIKRTPLGELFMVVVVDDVTRPEIRVETSRIAGFDFGLKTFLTLEDGSKIESPQFLKQSLNVIKKASRQHSKKRKGSANPWTSEIESCPQTWRRS